MSHFKSIMNDTVELHREEVMREIQRILDEQGPDASTVVTMGKCERTGKVIHEVIETESVT